MQSTGDGAGRIDDGGTKSPIGIPPGVIRGAAAVAEQFRSRTGVRVDVGEVLTGRARLLGTAPAGRVSAGGASHLLRTSNGWCAITLSRDDDVAAVPALVEIDQAPTDPWPMLREWASANTSADVVARAQLLDIPVAALNETVAASPRSTPLGATGEARRAAGLLVVDMTSMWAGPLCGQLLVRAGAIVVKVESPSRPDGTRRGNRAFFDWLNTAKLSYAAAFDRHWKTLHTLLTAADVVLEGSRPAALSRRGLGPHDVDGPNGRVWLRISGYGTCGTNARRPAFGDDAAVAGGLVGWDDGLPTFCGDAIADPLTGLTAARAVVEALGVGGGRLIEVAMAEVAASYARLPAAAGEPRREQSPLTRCAPASKLGADNAAVEQLLADRYRIPC